MEGVSDELRRGSGVEGVSGRRGVSGRNGVERVSGVIAGRGVMIIEEGDEDDWVRVDLLTRANH